MQMWEIQDYFKKINYLSLSINGWKPFQCISIDAINLDIDVDVKPVLKRAWKRDRALEFINIWASKYIIM